MMMRVDGFAEPCQEIDSSNDVYEQIRLVKREEKNLGLFVICFV